MFLVASVLFWRKGRSWISLGLGQSMVFSFGYASHSRAYRVLNLETNQIVETCEVTFYETQPRSQLVFECAGDDELGEEIFQEEEQEHEKVMG
jgi:hypothetical protein